jgi:hypothetical protein
MTSNAFVKGTNVNITWCWHNPATGCIGKGMIVEWISDEATSTYPNEKREGEGF